MKNKIILIITFISFLFISDVNAKTCNYSLDYILNGDGTIGSPAIAQKGGTIELNIEEDGTHNGTGKSNGTFLAEDFGGGNEKIQNWNSSYNGASAIGAQECPHYIGVNVQGLGDRVWYGFTSETIKSEGPKVADYDNSDSMYVFKWDDFDELPNADDSFVCDYNSFSIKVDLVNSTIYVDSNKNMYSNIHYTVSDALKKYWLEDKEKKDCVAIYSCNEPSASSVSFYYLYQDTASAYNDKKKSCTLNCLKDDPNCEQTECPTLTIFLQDLDNSYFNYAKSKDSRFLISANTLINKYSSVCNNLLSELNQDEPCAKECLKFESYIKNLKIKYNIEKTSPDGQCGLSGRLIIWIANIVRWVKYIVPVLIIVLGILDFMKAIGADKEDEMKKAQQRFIRRLIAAVLIFILPLIIEFVLNKMGFDSNGCGIINL